METYTGNGEEKQGINKVLIGAIVVAALIVAAGVGLIALKPSRQDVQEQELSGAFREGSPEFAQYTKRIIAETDENRTTQSPTGMGTIVMSIGGTIRNITGKTITGLEIKVSVIDSFGKMVKEKTLTVVPKQAERLANNEYLPVTVLMEGFNKDDDRANIRWKVTAIKIE
jgi:hypothetical protein